MSFYFVDEHKRTALPVWERIAGPGVLNDIHHYNQSVLSQPRVDIEDAIALIKTLPLIEKKKTYTYVFTKEQQVYAVACYDKFQVQAKVPNANLTPIDAQRSWENIEQIKNAALLLQRFLYDNNITKHLIGTLFAKRAVALHKKVAQGKISIQDVTAIDTFAQSRCLALYGCMTYSDGRIREGYVNPQNLLQPLAQAKFFESEKAIDVFLKRTNLLDSYGSLQIVDVAIHMQGIGKTLTSTKPKTTSHFSTTLSEGRLKEAIAHIEKEAMHKALDEASRDMLEQKLKHLEGENNSVRKKRM